tara:strand:- start:358 stop:489 length:132 start_codon:yes stop_codon:yes gene_type:complete
MPDYKKSKPMTSRSAPKKGLTKKQQEKLPPALKKAILKKKGKK